jgi:hypothetical protein
MQQLVCSGQLKAGYGGDDIDTNSKCNDVCQGKWLDKKKPGMPGFFLIATRN